MQITYESQRLSLRYFMLMLLLFGLQVAYGLILAAQQADPSLLAGELNFNVVRAGHLHLGILWIVSGFIGAILYVTPLLAKRDVVASWLIKLLFYVLILIVGWNLIAQRFAMHGIAGWWMGQPWIQNGLEFLEAGRIVGVGLLVGFALFATIIIKTFPPIKKWNEIHWGLGLGLTGLTLVWIFGLFYAPRLDVQEYFRWYVVHYWVEGVWEVLHISIVGALLVLMFKANVKSIGFAVFWGIALVWLSGLIGNAHHYFWIGTPEFWQFAGSFFSALEPVPLIFCFWHIYLDAHANKRPLVNAPVFYFLLGSTVLELVGAGILGFVMTFAMTNVWSHGTWVTAGHGHLALFGTFGMLAIAAAYWAVPAVRKAPHFNQKLGKLGFWLVFTGMLGMVLSFSYGGTIQIYLYRILGLDWYGGDVAPAMAFFKSMLLVCAGVFAVGALTLIYDLATLGRRVNEEPHVHEPVPAVGWHRPMVGFEAGIWLLFMWVFGLMITFSLVTFGLPSVREGGDPTLPYTLSGIGFAGLLLVTLGFVWRFTASLQSRLTQEPDTSPVPDLSESA